ncbi:hypothetical protein K435DRAFT_782990 [Dendrothele bispora CBS 962.96]|uniref:Uncharacterized protein n=1 Tax=Dendrothele bispora (strain CBS 962.96) TaxID=1314807 RepID=A0A4V4HD79_DENBC|nr:hypothetical protein K435DRAFT_782990 [Dendrothele bispora CBS 962.96]
MTSTTQGQIPWRSPQVSSWSCVPPRPLRRPPAQLDYDEGSTDFKYEDTIEVHDHYTVRFQKWDQKKCVYLPFDPHVQKAPIAEKSLKIISTSMLVILHLDCRPLYS